MKWWPDKYPSNCRQQHVGWVGYNHNDWPDDERCPVCRAMDEADAIRASLAAAEEKLADEVRHADALHAQLVKECGPRGNEACCQSTVDAMAAHAARRAGTTAVEREEGKR